MNRQLDLKCADVGITQRDFNGYQHLAGQKLAIRTWSRIIEICKYPSLLSKDRTEIHVVTRLRCASTCSILLLYARLHVPRQVSTLALLSTFLFIIHVSLMRVADRKLCRIWNSPKISIRGSSAVSEDHTLSRAGSRQ